MNMWVVVIHGYRYGMVQLFFGMGLGVQSSDTQLAQAVDADQPPMRADEKQVGCQGSANGREYYRR